MIKLFQSLVSEHIGLYKNGAVLLIEFYRFRQHRSDRNRLPAIIGYKRKIL